MDSNLHGPKSLEPVPADDAVLAEDDGPLDSAGGLTKRTPVIMVSSSGSLPAGIQDWEVMRRIIDPAMSPRQPCQAR